MDIDGPVANFSKAYINYCNMRFGYDMTLENKDKWNLHKCTGVPIKAIEDKQAFQEFCDIRMFAALELVDGAKEGLCALSGMGHDIIYITARPQSAHRTTAKWLVKKGLPIDGILFRNYDKGKFARHLGCAVAIDDKLENCIDFLRSGIFTVVWDALYNKSFIKNTNGTRVYGWRDIVALIGSDTLKEKLTKNILR